jgi:hypothetical protein
MEEEKKISEQEQILETLKTEYPIEGMLSFNETDINERLQENTLMVIKYKELYYRELQILEELENKMELLVGIRYKFYRFEDEHEWQKPEIEKFCIPSDKKIIAMKKIISKQKVRVRFFEIAYKAFESLGWRMKTYSDRERMGL